MKPKLLFFNSSTQKPIPHLEIVYNDNHYELNQSDGVPTEIELDNNFSKHQITVSADLYRTRNFFIKDSDEVQKLYLTPIPSTEVVKKIEVANEAAEKVIESDEFKIERLKALMNKQKENPTVNTDKPKRDYGEMIMMVVVVVVVVFAIYVFWQLFNRKQSVNAPIIEPGKPVIQPPIEIIPPTPVVKAAPVAPVVQAPVVAPVANISNPVIIPV